MRLLSHLFLVCCNLFKCGWVHACVCCFRFCARFVSEYKWLVRLSLSSQLRPHVRMIHARSPASAHVASFFFSLPPVTDHADPQKYMVRTRVFHLWILTVHPGWQRQTSEYTISLALSYAPLPPPPSLVGSGTGRSVSGECQDNVPNALVLSLSVPCFLSSFNNRYIYFFPSLFFLFFFFFLSIQASYLFPFSGCFPALNITV